MQIRYGNVVEKYHPSPYPTFGRVKHFHERFGRSYIAQKRIDENNPSLYAGAGGDPAVFQLRSDGNPVLLTPALESWMYRLLVESSQGKLSSNQVKLAYRSMLQGQRAYTNGFGWNDGYQSIILGENIGRGLMKLNLTIANGATVKLLGDKVWRKGEYQYPIEVLNAQDLSTLSRTLKANWWTIFTATNSTVDPAPEGKVEPFPKLENSNTTYDVVIPLLANNATVGWIESGWIEVLGQIKEPRYPYYKTWVSEAQWKINRGLI